MEGNAAREGLVLKLKAALGDMLPNQQGKKLLLSDRKGLEFDKNTVTAYRKLGNEKEKLEEYYNSTDDVPSQSDFIRWTKGSGKFSGRIIRLLSRERRLARRMEGLPEWPRKAFLRLKINEGADQKPLRWP